MAVRALRARGRGYVRLAEVAQEDSTLCKCDLSWPATEPRRHDAVGRNAGVLRRQWSVAVDALDWFLIWVTEALVQLWMGESVYVVVGSEAQQGFASLEVAVDHALRMAKGHGLGELGGYGAGGGQWKDVVAVCC